jgi:integrase
LISNIKQSLSQKAIQKKTIFLNENEFYEILNLAADFSELKELISLAQRNKDGFLISPDELNSMRLLELIALRCEILQNRSRLWRSSRKKLKNI